MLKLKLQCFGYLMAKNWLTGKDPDAGKHWRQEEKGTIEDEMVGWHHQLDVHDFEQAPGIGDGQGTLACCSPWGCKESDMTEGLNWTEGCSWETASIYIIENWTRPGSRHIWNAAKQNILACGQCSLGRDLPYLSVSNPADHALLPSYEAVNLFWTMFLDLL